VLEEASSTAKMVTCDEVICTSTLGAPSNDCKVGMYCSYMVAYGDGSNTSGELGSSIVTWNGDRSGTGSRNDDGNDDGNDSARDPDRYSIAIRNGRARSKIAKGLTIPVTMGSSQQALDGIHGVGQANSSVLS
ncbi:aspartic proteinase-like protein 2, partial [Tanacetum coccineum]